MFLNDFAPLALSVQSMLFVVVVVVQSMLFLLLLLFNQCVQVSVPFLFLLFHSSLQAYVYKIGTHGVINVD